jgi:hypothetical protein
MKKLLLIAVLATAFVAKSQAQVTTINDPTAPVMKFSVDTIDFGTINQGTIVEKDFAFKNTGKTPLVITSATGSCHCTVPHYPEEPIAPGKTGVIHVVFDSNGKMGYQLKTATINSNNRDGVVVLYLTGTVVVPPAPPTPTTPPANGGK